MANQPDTSKLLAAAASAIATATECANLRSDRHTPWELVHAALGLGAAAKITDSAANRITLLAYFANSGPSFGESIYRIADGMVSVRKSGLRRDCERHPNQFLAYFSQLGLDDSTSLLTDGGVRTIRDLVSTAEATFDPLDETTFTLVALSSYCKWDDEWLSASGKYCTLKDVLVAEMAKPLEKAACRGAHTLYGYVCVATKFSSELRQFPELAAELRGRIEQQRTTAKTTQQPDGSLLLYAGTPFQGNQERQEREKLFSTGHALEWILLGTSDPIGEGWICDAIRYLARAVQLKSGSDVPASTWYHAVHALRMACALRTNSEGELP